MTKSAFVLLVGVVPVAAACARVPSAASHASSDASAQDAAANESPTSAYLDGMYQRIHPIFAQFLQLLAGLPAVDTINDPKLHTMMEISLHGDGSIARIHVIRSSGVPQFDEHVARSVGSAVPFAPVPPELLSADHLFWVSWDFFRDPARECATANAQVLHKTSADLTDGED